MWASVRFTTNDWVRECCLYVFSRCLFDIHCSSTWEMRKIERSLTNMPQTRLTILKKYQPKSWSNVKTFKLNVSDKNDVQLVELFPWISNRYKQHPGSLIYVLLLLMRVCRMSIHRAQFSGFCFLRSLRISVFHQFSTYINLHATDVIILEGNARAREK